MEPTYMPVVEETDESEVDVFSAQPAREPQRAEMTSEFSLMSDQTLLSFPVEIPASEEEPISSSPEATGLNTLTEEQLPTQTVLDNLFSADTSSMPEFLAQLSSLGELNVPATPVYKVEDALFSAGSFTTPPVEQAEFEQVLASSDTATPVEHIEVAQVPASSDAAVPVEGIEAPVLPDSSGTVLPVEQAEAAPVPDSSDTVASVEGVEAPILADSSAATSPLDSSDQTDGISTTAKVKAGKKRKASGSPQTSTATSKDAQRAKKQTNGGNDTGGSV